MKKVFLSSTFRDLHQYRDAADSVLRLLDGYHCIRMEDFGARDREADEFCRQKVAECGLYVGILGPNYGSIHEPSGKSYTEREFDMAIECNIPRLMFLTVSNFALGDDLREPDDKHNRQRAFRNRAVNAIVRDSFSSFDDLGTKLAVGIRNWEIQSQSAANQTNTKTETSPSFLPLPPQPYFAHPYPMQPNFTGRVAERRMLTNWFMQGDQHVLVLEAMGGMGKSALTWAWVQRDLLGLPLPGTAADPVEGCRVPDDARPEGVLWWSFYEEKAAFSSFLNKALRYLSGGTVDPISIGSDFEKAHALFELLLTKRVLLVLDGFERELRAYASLNASYMGDAIREDAKQEFRTCVNPTAARFLNWIGGTALASHVLFTTRLFPKQLEGHDRQPLANCRHGLLMQLDPDDAVHFFHAQGIKGTRAEIQQACEPFGYHPLTLRLLSGMILHAPEDRGDIKAAPKCDPIRDLKAREHHVLELSYDALSDPLRDFLSRIAAFRTPISYEAIQAISPINGETQLGEALTELQDRGHLFYVVSTSRFDLHPIVRRYAYDRLMDKTNVHVKLRDYFSSLPKREGKVRSMDELQPVIELYHHTVRAGQLNVAGDLFRDRLNEQLYFQFGAYGIVIELLTGLFPEGKNVPPVLISKSLQGWFLSKLADCFDFSGQSQRSIPLRKLSIDLAVSEKNERNAGIARSNLAEAQRKLGLLQESEECLKLALLEFQEEEDSKQQAVCHQELCLLWSVMGRYSEAATAAINAESLSENTYQYLEFVRTYQAYASLLADDALAALQHLETAGKLWSKVAAEIHPYERDRVQIEWLVGWAKTVLATADEKNGQKLLHEAEGHLTDALTSCRRIDLVELETEILLVWSRWHFAKGNLPEAFVHAREALEIAERCEYRLQQADIHNMLAKLFLKEGNHPKALEHAKISIERATCDGPPYYYKPAYEEAERLLKELA